MVVNIESMFAGCAGVVVEWVGCCVATCVPAGDVTRVEYSRERHDDSGTDYPVSFVYSERSR